MIGSENCQIIFEAQDGRPQAASDVPLVLIHDGGGTCFAYYCLNPLGRTTYEIHNPRYESQVPWAGGIPEMARHYVRLMRAAVPPGRILLGGWSLGGILSLEMARLLAQDGRYQVVGIVMIDSICPLGAKTLSALLGNRITAFQGQWGPHTKQETKDRVTWCFAEARRALAAYELPTWNDEQSKAKIPCPPTILLRAKEAVQVQPGDVSFVDVLRNNRSLGWDAYRNGMFEEIVDIPGHHFNIFDFDHIDVVSDKLTEACSKLEALSKSRRSTGVRR